MLSRMARKVTTLKQAEPLDSEEILMEEAEVEEANALATPHLPKEGKYGPPRRSTHRF